MMSLILIATVTAVAASVGYLASRRKVPEKPGVEKDQGQDAAAAENKGESAFEGLPLGLGDVVTSGGEERWLAGAIIAEERGEVVAVVFIAPEGATHGAIAAFAPPREDIYWLEPTEVESPDEPPATLEIRGVAMRRRGRLPVSLRPMGQGTPRVGEAGIFATYDGGASDVTIVIGSEGRTWAWTGRRLLAGEYERLGAGGDG